MKATKYEGGAFVAGNKIILSSTGIVNRYEDESKTVYEAKLEAIYDGQGDNEYCGSTQTGYYTDLEVYFIPEGVAAADCETSGTLIYTSTAPSLSSMASVIESGQTNKGFNVPYGNGSSDVGNFYLSFKMMM